MSIISSHFLVTIFGHESGETGADFDGGGNEDKVDGDGDGDGDNDDGVVDCGGVME